MIGDLAIIKADIRFLSGFNSEALQLLALGTYVHSWCGSVHNEFG